MADDITDLSDNFALLSKQLEEIDSSALALEPDLQAACTLVKKESLQLISNVYNNKVEIESALNNYKKAIDGSLENCMHAAKTEQTHHLQKIFSDLYEHYIKNPETLKKTRFVFVGPHAPRDNLIEMSIMKKLFSNFLKGLTIVNHSIFYLEERVYLSEQLDIENDIIRGFLADAEYIAKLSTFMYGSTQVLEADLLSQCPHLANA